MSTEGQRSTDAAVIRAIVRHLRRHPDAKDTAEGILAWWLPAGGTGLTVEDVQRAAATLCEQGWLEVRVFGPSRIVYGLNGARRAGRPAGPRDGSLGEHDVTGLV